MRIVCIKNLSSRILGMMLFLLFCSDAIAQDILNIEVDCERDCLDLTISGGFPPFEVEWKKWDPNQSDFVTVNGWPIFDSDGNDGSEDLCGVESGRYRAIVTDALCGTIEKSIPYFACSCVNLTLLDKQNVTQCAEAEADVPGSTASQSCDGELNVGITAPAGYTISWSGPNGFNSNNSVISDLCVGEYTCTVKHGTCEISKSFEICCCNVTTFSSNLQQFESCFEFGTPTEFVVTGMPDSENKKISLSISGQTNDIVINWSGPNNFASNSLVIEELEFGTYCVEVTNGCQSEDLCFEILPCGPGILDFNSVEACPSTNDGSVSVSLKGGYSPISIQWSNGAIGSINDNLIAGEYCVTISTDGCGIVEGCVNVATSTDIEIVHSSFTVPVEQETFDGDIILFNNLVCVRNEVCRDQVVNSFNQSPLIRIGWKPTACFMEQICEDGTIRNSPWMPLPIGSDTRGLVWDMDHIISFDSPTCRWFANCPFANAGLIEVEQFAPRCLGSTDHGNGVCSYEFECCKTIGWVIWPFWPQRICDPFTFTSDCGRFCDRSLVGEDPLSIMNINKGGKRRIIVSGITLPDSNTFVKEYDANSLKLENDIRLTGIHKINMYEKFGNCFSYGSLPLSENNWFNDYPVDELDGKDGYLVKYDPKGDPFSIFHFGGKETQSLIGMTSNVENNIMAIGSFEKELKINNIKYIEKVDSQNGFLVMIVEDQIQKILTSNATLQGIESLNKDYFVYGKFHDGLKFGTEVIVDQGKGSFVIRLDKDGNIKNHMILDVGQIKLLANQSDLKLIAKFKTAFQIESSFVNPVNNYNIAYIKMNNKLRLNSDVNLILSSSEDIKINNFNYENGKNYFDGSFSKDLTIPGETSQSYAENISRAFLFDVERQKMVFKKK